MHRDRELIDRRLLESSWSQPGIEVEIDPETRLEVLLARGEGPQIEFKRELGAEPRTLMKTVAAFANGAGGAIVLGVDDDGVVTGLPDHSRPGDRDRLTTPIRDWVRPLVSFEVDSVDAGGNRVVIVDVAAGPDPPYGVGTSERDVTYYIRRGATSFPASPADVRALARSRPASHDDTLGAYLSTLRR